MRRTATVLACIALAACGSEESAPPPLTARDFALVKVSGDGQSDVVKLATDGGAALSVSYASRAVATDPTMFPEALVVKVVPRGGPSFYRGGSLMPTSPSFAEAPGWLPTVTWRVVEDGCGEPFTAAEVPAGDSTVATFWFKGTKAGGCHMRAQTVERDSAGNLVPIVQQEFTATQLPGPVDRFNFEYRPASPYVAIGDSIDLREALLTAQDAYGNPIEVADLAAGDGEAVRWGWSNQPGDPVTTHTGWIAIVPDTAGVIGRARIYSRDTCDDPAVSCMHEYRNGVMYLPLLTVWIGDSEPASERITMPYDDPDDPTNR